MVLRALRAPVALALLAGAGVGCGSEAVPRRRAAAACRPPLGEAEQAYLRRGGVAATGQVPGSVRAGDSVPLALVVRNGRATPVVLEQAAVTRADFVVTPAGDSASVWRLVAGGVIGEGGFTDTVPPGGERVYRATWDGRTRRGTAAPPGEYCVYGYLVHGPPQVAAPAVPARFTITR
jgi:hypothetical protein